MPYSQVWDLDSLHPHPELPAFSEALTSFEQRLSKLTAQVDNLPPVGNAPDTLDAWSEFLEDWAQAQSLGGELDSFIGCHAAADAGNKSFRALEAKLAALRPQLERISTALEFRLQDTIPDALESFLASDARLSRIAFFVRDRREQAQYRLPQEQELLFSELSVDGMHAWGRLYDRLSGDLRITVQEKGELVQKSPGQVQFDDPSRTVRENNFFAAAKAWETIGESCADSLNHLSGTRLTRYRRLGLRDHLDVPLAANRMQRATLDTMWGEITKFKAKLTEYFDAKARLLGVSKLAWYDLAAPLPEKFLGREETKITYDRACELIVESFSKFSPDFGEFAQMAVDQRWIEAENRPGKRQGGFCTGFLLHKQSRIFMTYNDTADNMSTLAHELGHAYHSWALNNEPLLLQDYPMNLAETASTFAEAVLGEERLNAAGPEAQLGILDGMLGDAVAFLMNIHARFLFEDRFHVERKSGELSPERFTELMVEAQREAYLDALDSAGWNPTFWISKLHFYITYVPFYNFPYTFGYLLSLGLYALAGQYGPQFPERYRQLLINTGCMSAEAAVQAAFGHDLTQPQFWQESLKIIGQRVDRFVELARPLC